MADNTGGGEEMEAGGGGTNRSPDRRSGKGGGEKPLQQRGKRDEGAGGHRGKGGHEGHTHTGKSEGGRGHIPKKTLFEEIPTSQTLSIQNTNTNTHNNTPKKHQNTYLEDSNNSEDMEITARHSTPINKKAQPYPQLPTHTIREWTLNREDKLLHNNTGQTRIPTSEEWRGFQLIDIQWKNKQQKLKQQQDLLKQRKQQQQQQKEHTRAMLMSQSPV